MTSSQAPRDAIISRTVDFWLIGGASLVAIVVVAVFSAFRDSWSVRHHFESIAVVMGTLSLFINYPHFMASYRIAYGRGWNFVKTHWFQLLFVPLALIGLSIWSYVSFNAPNSLPNLLNPLELNQGRGVLMSMVSLMYLTVGWHYVKQTFGCMMVYSKLDKYKLTPFQRKLLLYTLYFVWFGNFLNSNTGPMRVEDHYGMPLASMSLPLIAYVMVQVVFWLMLGAFAFVIVAKHREHGRWPSLNFITPLVALVIWWIPIFYQQEYYFYMVPFFHSLQYIPFAWRYEVSKSASRKGRIDFGGSLVILLLILTGYLAFEVVPGLADTYFPPEKALNAVPFVIMANVFINIHHYFIDNTIWRFQQAEVRQYLFNEKPESPALYPMPEMIGEQALQEA